MNDRPSGMIVQEEFGKQKNLGLISAILGTHRN